jgi:hypothetical protein
MRNFDNYDLRLLTELVGKEELLKMIDNKLASIVYDGCTKLRDDLWQEQFNELQQIKSKLIGYKYRDRMQMLLEQLTLTSEALRRQLAENQELNSFYDIKITLNGVEHSIPMNADIYTALTDYLNDELSN